MVSYNLCLNNKKIDLSLIGLANSNKLITIDKFTSNFVNQEEIINFLMKKGIKIDECTNPQLNIQYKHKDIINYLPIVYMGEREYMNFDKNKIQQLNSCFVSTIDLPIYDKFMSLIYDDKFIKELWSHYKNNYAQYINCIDLYNYMHDKSLGGVDSSKSVITSIFNNIFLSAAGCRTDSNNQIKIDYKSLRELTLFICEYSESNIKIKTDDYDSFVVYNPETGEYEKMYSKQLSLFKTK